MKRLNGADFFVGEGEVAVAEELEVGNDVGNCIVVLIGFEIMIGVEIGGLDGRKDLLGAVGTGNEI